MTVPCNTISISRWSRDDSLACHCVTSWYIYQTNIQLDAPEDSAPGYPVTMDSVNELARANLVNVQLDACKGI